MHATGRLDEVSRRRRQDETVGCDIGAPKPASVRTGLVVQNSGTIPPSGRQSFSLFRASPEGVSCGGPRGDCRKPLPER